MSNITMDMIAAELGISKNTVSRALRGLSGVSEETRQKIISFATENGYRVKQKNATLLHVAMIYKKSLNNDLVFWPSVLSGIMEYAADKGVSIRIFTVDSNNDSELLFSLREQTIDGLLIINDLEDSLLRQLMSLNKPMVVADSFHDGIDCDYVNTANRNGIYKAISHLTENNHQRIGFIGTKDWKISFQARYDAYLHYMGKFGLPIDDQFIWLGANWSDYDYFRERIALLQNRKIAPTAWLCVNDAMAVSFAHVLNEYNYRIPEDISIIGFDNATLPLMSTLTTLNVEEKELGQRALEQLMVRIKSPKPPFVSIYLNTTLIVRNSVKRL